MRRAKPRADPRQLHELFLEDGNPQRLLQHRLGERVWVSNGLVAVPPTQVGVNGITLDGTRTDQGDLNGQVVKRLGLHPRQGGHLGPRLNLKETHRVGLGEHRIDGGLLFDRGEVDVHTVRIRNGVDGQVQGVEHSEPEQVEFHDTDGRTAFFVPLKN